MIRLIQIFCLFLFLSACSKAKQTNQSQKGNPSLTAVEQQSKEPSQEQEYFSNIEDFKKFVSRKWVALIGDEPCASFKRTIKFENNFLYEYDGMEPTQYKIEKIKQIDSKTLDIKIENDLDYDVIFRVEVLDLKEKLVKWTVNGEEYYEKTKPYDIVCGGSGDYKEGAIMSNESSFSKKWEGFYQFTSVEEGEENVELGEGKSYDLYISLDSVNLKSYGYRHLENRKSYAIEKEGALFIYNQDPDEGLLLKLILKDNEYIATSLTDRKGEFKVLKK
ncbi:hypothetical protein ACFSTE_20410 [Aquimarina hainanensis]|uniref:Lipoprotein n=1 Tax=Aquimarina hainanensis TaxID=1578017 RepID=A0ABW5NG60_9FLAO